MPLIEAYYFIGHKHAALCVEIFNTWSNITCFRPDECAGDLVRGFDGEESEFVLNILPGTSVSACLNIACDR